MFGELNTAADYTQAKRTASNRSLVRQDRRIVFAICRALVLPIIRVCYLPYMVGWVRKINFLPDSRRVQPIRLDRSFRFAFLMLMQVISFETGPRAVQFNRVSAEIGGKNGDKQ